MDPSNDEPLSLERRFGDHRHGTPRGVREKVNLVVCGAQDLWPGAGESIFGNFVQLDALEASKRIFDID